LTLFLLLFLVLNAFQEQAVSNRSFFGVSIDHNDCLFRGTSLLVLCGHHRYLPWQLQLPASAKRAL
jgi:hypothetical protein